MIVIDFTAASSGSAELIPVRGVGDWRNRYYSCTGMCHGMKEGKSQTYG